MNSVCVFINCQLNDDDKKIIKNEQEKRKRKSSSFVFKQMNKRNDFFFGRNFLFSFQTKNFSLSINLIILLIY